MASVTQMWLSRSRMTLAPLSTITTARARAEGLCVGGDIYPLDPLEGERPLHGAIGQLPRKVVSS
jgi:hypothetical protein